MLSLPVIFINKKKWEIEDIVDVKNYQNKLQY